jgi:DNA-binding transcriptional LysR family regulator
VHISPVHINRIDLNLLVVLDAIYTEGGITRAAEKLHLTQPAISHALGRLREIFGDPLFAREGRAMVPTPLMRNLIEPLRRSLRGLQVMLNEIEQFDPAVTRKTFTIGVRDVLEATLLPPLTAAICAKAPLVELAAIRADRKDLEAELADGSIDAAIDVLLPASGNLRHTQLSMDRMVVIARKDHPEVDEELDVETYLMQDHVLVSSRRSGAGLEDVELSRLGMQRRIRLRCQHYFAACRVVSQTDLVLTMPGRYAVIANQQFGNQIIRSPIDITGMDAYLYWHASVENDPANRWLRAEITGALAGASGGA